MARDACVRLASGTVPLTVLAAAALLLLSDGRLHCGGAVIWRGGGQLDARRGALSGGGDGGGCGVSG